jgi:hypothetical protein
MDRDWLTLSLSKRWNVARVTSEVSSSPMVKAWAGAVAGDGTPAIDSLVVAVVAAKDSPARPNTDNAVFDRLALARFIRDMGTSIPIRLKN